MINVILKGGRCVTKAKGHHEGLKETEACDEGSFPFVAFGDAELIKCGDDIEFCIDLGVTKSVQRLSYQWEWVTILNGDVIKTPVVLTYTDSPPGLAASSNEPRNVLLIRE